MSSIVALGPATRANWVVALVFWTNIEGIVRRHIGRARRRLQRLEWFRAHAMAEPRSFEMGAPLEEPSDGGGPPELPASVDRLGQTGFAVLLETR